MSPAIVYRRQKHGFFINHFISVYFSIFTTLYVVCVRIQFVAYGRVDTIFRKRTKHTHLERDAYGLPNIIFIFLLTLKFFKLFIFLLQLPACIVDCFSGPMENMENRFRSSNCPERYTNKNNRCKYRIQLLRIRKIYQIVHSKRKRIIIFNKGGQNRVKII